MYSGMSSDPTIGIAFTCRTATFRRGSVALPRHTHTSIHSFIHVGHQRQQVRSTSAPVEERRAQQVVEESHLPAPQLQVEGVAPMPLPGESMQQGPQLLHTTPPPQTTSHHIILGGHHNTQSHPVSQHLPSDINVDSKLTISMWCMCMVRYDTIICNSLNTFY